MSLNPGGATNYNWNYSNQNKDGYSETLVGTVLAMQEVQSRAYNPGSGQPGAPEFWPDGNPKMNIRIALADQNGNLKTFTFQPAGKEARQGLKPSVHMELFHLTGDTDMTNLIGKTIQLQTWPANPQTGQAWMRGNPRQFAVSEVDAGPFTLVNPAQLPSDMTVPRLMADNAVSGGQMNQGVAPAQIQQPAYPVQPAYGVQQGYAAQPAAAMPQYAQPMQAQPVAVAQPVMAQPIMQPQVPAGMDPQIAAAMQAVGATNIQPVAEPVEPYSEEIPF